MEDVPSSEEDFDLDAIPGKALNVSSRITLSMLLNPKQPLPSTNGYARDFRGLAQQMDFEYMHIRNFECHSDPTSQVLEAWECKPDATIGSLICMLKEMDRHDVIEDCLQQFKIDARSHLKRNKVKSEIPIQVPEVTSCRSVTDIFQLENPNALTIQDVRNGGCTYYDAYVCYALEDEYFVGELAKILESEMVGLKLFMKGRDQLCGISEPDAYVKLIEERCNKMLIILSPDFLNSNECDFQANYAAGLAIEQRRRKLVPILVRNCNIPSILKFVTKIDFTRTDIHNWLWDKLIVSIRGLPTTLFVTPEESSMLVNSCRNQTAIEQPSSSSQPAIGHNPPSFHPAIAHHFPSLQTAGHHSSSQPVITFPPTQSYQLPSSTNPLTLGEAVYSTAAYSAVAIPSASQNLIPAPVTAQKNTSSTRPKWLQTFREKFSSLNSSSSSSSPASSTSSATSGFHSQSGVVFESGEIPENETSM